ncbi:hypothetical protein F0327_25340 [Citrobacter braakii]|nr:hypothetical protein F0327_25340 [Citrobacter braakii]
MTINERVSDERLPYDQTQRDIMKDIMVRKLGGNLVGAKLEMADIHAATMALIDAGFRSQQYCAAAEPIYQYRLRNGYNGFYTEWQTIKRDQVDFVLKAQPLNAEFRIIAAPQVTSVPIIPERLHPATADLVLRFASALAQKLLHAEQKYGYSDNWQKSDWSGDCLQSLREHVDKGDPRDVAAYCAFMWHHGWSTAAPAVQAEQCNHQVIPAGYALVPIEPTESMIINGFESEPDSFFSDPKSWAAYQAMSGCQQAAHRAKLCWAAMVKTALQQEKG